MIGRARGSLELVAPASALVLFGLAAVGWEDGVPMLLATVAGFCAGRLRRRLVGGASMALLLAACVADSTGDTIVPMVMLPATMFAAGAALRAREAVAERLAAQAEELEAERELYARLSVRYERSRIAAELHDVVAHAISVMVVQASAGQRLAVAGPDATRETFAIIGAAARQAEADLDGLAELLSREGDDGGDLQLVQEIVSRAQASGLPVTLRFEGDGQDIRGAAVHVASRVVQESLTNALRYAPGAPVRVTVTARPARVDVEVANRGGATGPALGLGSGRGLSGLRERVADCGGTLAAGPDDDDGWTVRASIPRGAVATG